MNIKYNEIMQMYSDRTNILVLESLYLILSFTPYQTFIFLEILLKIRNQHKVLRKKVDKKLYFLSKPPNITFRTPNLKTTIKPVGNIFDRRDPKKTVVYICYNSHEKSRYDIFFSIHSL